MTALFLFLINTLSVAKEEIFTYIDSATGQEETIYAVAYSLTDVVLDIFNLVNFIVPVDTIITCCIVILLINIALFNAFGLNWVIRRILDAIP